MKHSYLGGQQLREKCKSYVGWKQGDLVQVKKWIRSSETDLIDDVEFYD